MGKRQRQSIEWMVIVGGRRSNADRGQASKHRPRMISSSKRREGASPLRPPLPPQGQVKDTRMSGGPGTIQRRRPSLRTPTQADDWTLGGPLKVSKTKPRAKLNPLGTCGWTRPLGAREPKPKPQRGATSRRQSVCIRGVSLVRSSSSAGGPERPRVGARQPTGQPLEAANAHRHVEGLEERDKRWKAPPQGLRSDPGQIECCLSSAPFFDFFCSYKLLLP